MTTHDTALEIVEYLRKRKTPAPAFVVCALFNIGNKRTLRKYIRYIRENITWVNSCSTPGRNGYSLGARDSAQLEKHAASEFALVVIRKRREKQHPRGQMRLL